MIIVHVASVLLGDGMRLFERADGGPVQLEPISSRAEGQMTVLRYSIRPGSPCDQDRRAARMVEADRLRPFATGGPR